MKIRQGFVSNSSSSSFVLVANRSFYQRMKFKLACFCVGIKDKAKTLFGKKYKNTKIEDLPEAEEYEWPEEYPDWHNHDDED